MRERTPVLTVVSMAFLMAVIFVTGGCSMLSSKVSPADTAQTAPNQPAAPVADKSTPAEADLNAKIQAHADQLLAALERQQAQQKLQQQQRPARHAATSTDPAVDRLALALDQHAKTSLRDTGDNTTENLPQVQWLDLSPAPATAPQPIAKATRPVKPLHDVAVTPAPAATVPVMTVGNPVQGTTADPAALTQQLAANIRKSEQTALQKALALSSLSLGCNENMLNADDLRDLDQTELQQVRKMHTMVLQTLARQPQGQSTNKDYQSAMNDQITKLFGPATTRIGKVELCRTVSGYGVYEPFESTTFMAGVEQPLILYVELENFNSLYDGNQYRVRLTQEVALYTDVDGVRVWFLPSEEIVDVSRNKRRDFFTVQLLHLPARLGVGQYRLKIRIHDINASSYDETTVPITLVATQSTTARSKDTTPAPTRSN